MITIEALTKKCYYKSVEKIISNKNEEKELLMDTYTT